MLRNPAWVFGLYILLVALAAPGIFRLQIDNEVEGFFLQDSRAIRQYRQFQLDFGSDRAGRILLYGNTLWTGPTLAWVARTETELGRIDGVLGAAGLYHHHRHSFSQWPPANPAAFRERVLDDPLDRAAGFVSPQGDLITILFALNRLGPGERRQALQKVRVLLDQPPPGAQVALAGLPVLVDRVDRSILEWIWLFFPWLILAAVLLLWLVFRSLPHVLIPLLFVGAMEIVVLGGLGYLHSTVDMITLLEIPLLFVISLATAVHVLVRFRFHLARIRQPVRALRLTYAEKGWAIFWTGLTTLVGFASIAASEVPPLRRLGISVGLGIGLMTLSMFLLYPLLLTLPRKVSGAFQLGFFEQVTRPFGRKLALFSLNRQRPVLCAFAAVAVLAGWGLSRLRVQSSVLDYFPSHSEERKAHDLLQRNGIAPVAVDLILSARGSDSPFARIESLRNLDILAGEIRALEPAVEAVSAASLLESLWREESPALPGASPYGPAILRRVAEDADLNRLFSSLRTRDGKQARVSVLVPFQGLHQIGPMLDRAVESASRLFPGLDIRLTGQYLLTIQSQARLLPTMLWSFGLTLCLISLIFLFITRSPKLWVVSLLPNYWPVLFVLGGMGWLEIALDSTTVAIAAILLGLAVDDTLHTLGYYRRARGTGRGQRVAATLEKAAGAHLLTSGVLAAGFAICGLSSFLPIAEFGWLAAAGITAALGADLLLFPLLLTRVPAVSDHRAPKQ